jgi:hypothetical protein
MCGASQRAGTALHGGGSRQQSVDGGFHLVQLQAGCPPALPSPRPCNHTTRSQHNTLELPPQGARLPPVWRCTAGRSEEAATTQVLSVVDCKCAAAGCMSTPGHQCCPCTYNVVLLTSNIGAPHQPRQCSANPDGRSARWQHRQRRSAHPAMRACSASQFQVAVHAAVVQPQPKQMAANISDKGIASHSHCILCSGVVMCLQIQHHNSSNLPVGIHAGTGTRPCEERTRLLTWRTRHAGQQHPMQPVPPTRPPAPPAPPAECEPPGSSPGASRSPPRWLGWRRLPGRSGAQQRPGWHVPGRGRTGAEKNAPSSTAGCVGCIVSGARG